MQKCYDCNKSYNEFVYRRCPFCSGEIEENEAKLKNLKVGDYEALRMITDIKVMTLVKIDEKTIIYIVADSEGRCLVDEIYNDTEYKNILKNIKVSVKRK